MVAGTDSASRPIKLTYEDYVTLPDDGRRYEILDGELAVSPAPTSRHQLACENLGHALSIWVRARKLGRIWRAPIDLILAPTTVVQPDLLYVSNARRAIVSERGLESAPDLVIEILSDSTAARDRGVKMQIYARYGVPHYWILDTKDRLLETYVRGNATYERTALYRDGDVIGPDLPEGFTMPVVEIWSED
jgi:Uma2 family endonuclease